MKGSLKMVDEVFKIVSENENEWPNNKITYYTKEGIFETLDDSDIPYYKLHRENGPALIEEHWEKRCWYINGKLHRLNGPAVIYNENKTYQILEWWVNGKKHRINGPAIINNMDKRIEWWVNGKLHRLDGLAITGSRGKYDCISCYAINGKRLGIREHVWVNNNIDFSKKKDRLMFKLTFA